MKKTLHYTLKILKITLLLVIVLYAAAYIYVSVNKKEIIAQEGFKKTADISFFKSFPGIAVHAQDISVTDTLYNIHKHTFFAAKDVFINLSILKLIQKKSALSGIKIIEGNFFLYTDTSGYTNSYLLKSKKDPQGGPKKTSGNFTLEKILLQNMHFTLLDNKREKYHDFSIDELKITIDDVGENAVMQTKASMLIKSLAFNVPKGTFLKDASFAGNFKMQYGKKSQVLSFDNITVKLSGQPFNLSGTFDLGDKNPGFTLKVKTKNVLYDDVKKLLPKRIDSSLSIVSLDKQIDGEADLYGPLRGGEPYIIARWNVKNTALKTPFMDFDDASFTGYYTNEVKPGLPRKDPNSKISIKEFTGDWHGLKVNSGSIEILDLQTPLLTCDMRSAFPLTSLNELLQTNSLQFTDGNAHVLLNYKGPIERNNNTNSFLNGAINFENGKILYTPRNVLMTNVNGALQFQNSNVIIQNVKCKVMSNDIVMNGTAENALTLINSAPNMVNIKYNIYSPSLNLAEFTYLLQARKKTTAPSKNKLAKMTSKIDDVLEQSRIEVDLKAGRLLYNRINAANLNAGITILQDRYILNNVSMNFADGSMDMKGSLINIENGRHRASLAAGMQHVNVQKVLYAFKNFGQDGITDKNLEGSLTATADVNIELSNEGKVLPATSEGVVNFSLKNGSLNNFEPIKKIQRSVFKNRDFENIRFAELKDKLEINRGEIKINRMEIQSSVISLFVEGLFSTRGNTDISVQVPLSNLKKRDENYEPENIGVDKKGGRSIFLRGQPGKDGNIDFKLDLFKKYKKENGTNK